MKLLILFGLPGAGKGVIAQNLKENYNFNHLSLGEHLRKEVKNKTTIGIKYRQDIQSGLKLIPSKIVFEIINKEILNSLKNNNNLIIDGFPRTVEQYNYFNKYLIKYNMKAYYFYLKANENLLIKRLLTRETCSGCSHDYIMNV